MGMASDISGRHNTVLQESPDPLALTVSAPLPQCPLGGVFCRHAHWDWSSGRWHSGQFQLRGLRALFLKCTLYIILLLSLA